jgi:hypothetical protein
MTGGKGTNVGEVRSVRTARATSPTPAAKKELRTPAFLCAICKERFPSREHLLSHQRERHPDG